MELQEPLWTAAVDFKKAFDTVSHMSLLEAMAEQQVGGEYVELFFRLYSDQRGQVKGSVCSKKFAIQRGTKQGDPISPVLFNAILEKGMRCLKVTWTERGYGFRCQRPGHSEEWLQNLRFADDI